MSRLISMALFLAAAAHGAVSIAATELVTNGGAETGDLTGWTVVAGGTCAVSDLAHSGNWSLTGGTSGITGPWTNTMEQVVDLGSHAAAIDASNADVAFTGWARSNEAGGNADIATVSIQWRDATGGPTASYSSGPITTYNQWVMLGEQRTVPPGTRSVRISLTCRRQVGISTDGFFDDLSLLLTSEPDGCVADINGDGAVNLSDIPQFAGDFLAGTHPARSDLNGDGLVNLSDIPLLAAAMGTTGCS